MMKLFYTLLQLHDSIHSSNSQQQWPKEVNITVYKLYFNIFNCNESKVTINVGKCLCFKGGNRGQHMVCSQVLKSTQE